MSKNDDHLDEVSGRVLALAARVMTEQGINRTPHLRDSLAEEGLGLDSMGRLELLQVIEQELGVSIPEEYWGTRRFKDLGDVVRVAAKAARRKTAT